MLVLLFMPWRHTTSRLALGLRSVSDMNRKPLEIDGIASFRRIALRSVFFAIFQIFCARKACEI